MISLTDATLPAVADGGLVATPGYDRSDLEPGIVHIGVGNFHRAHQAAAIDALLRQGVAREWAICGVGLLPGDARMRNVLQAQDGLYLLELKHPDGRREPRVIGSIIDYLYAPDDPSAVVDRLADASTRIVSLTITEGGYRVDRDTRTFDLDHPDIRHDLENPAAPLTAFGLIVAALRRCRDAGRPPFTVLSCDNLESNGDTARIATTTFAERLDDDLAEWIAAHVPFPNSMVDRITPATTDDDRAHARDVLLVDDGWPVPAEPYFQWVIEDRFSRGRPPLDAAGAQLVDDVAPFELMKLRLLNCTHQAMAYLGYLAGYRYVDQAMRDEDLRTFVRAYMDEATPTLAAVPGIDLDQYKETLVSRFSNPAIEDTLARLAADASDRIPRWLVPVVRENLAAGRDVRISAAICASWARYAEGVDEAGQPIHVIDRLADERQAAAARQRTDPTAFLQNTTLFGDLAKDRRFTSAYIDTLASLHERGAAATCRELLSTRIG